MSLKSLKHLIGAPLLKAGGFALLHRGQRLIWPNHLRAVNYHGTPAVHRDHLCRQLEWLRRHYDDVSYEDLERFMTTGHWHKERPGLIVSFDDGLESNYSVAAPALESVGFTGWFMVPSGFINTIPGRQRDFVAAQVIDVPDEVPTSDGRLAMTWGEIAALIRRGHVIGCHTRQHVRLRDSVRVEEQVAEIEDARQDFVDAVNYLPMVFCWVGGEEGTYAPAAASRIAAAGYRYSLMSLAGPIMPGQSAFQMHRVNLSPTDSLGTLAFQLSGATDIKFWPRRRRVNRLTAAAIL